MKHTRHGFKFGSGRWRLSSFRGHEPHRAEWYMTQNCCFTINRLGLVNIYTMLVFCRWGVSKTWSDLLLLVPGTFPRMTTRSLNRISSPKCLWCTADQKDSFRITYRSKSTVLQYRPLRVEIKVYVSLYDKLEKRITDEPTRKYDFPNASCP